jgi:transposase InsO family protein
MKRSKFTEAQIAFILRQAEEGTAIGEVCRKAGISEATYYNWRKKYAGLMPSEMKRLRLLEEENGKLKKIVAEPRFTFRGADVVEVLEEVGRQVGFPTMIRVDQGTEFVSRDLDLWAYHRDVVLDFSRPGKPTDNAFIESFNGKFRAECLNAHWFMSLDDARRKCEAWRRDYNEERPHSAIGNKAPIELVSRSVAYGPP